MESLLLERIERWSNEDPNKTILSFADDHGKIVASITTGELWKKIKILAAILLSTPQEYSKGMNLKHGDRVLLVYPPGLEFIVAFLACLRSGLVAVPVYPPDPRKMKKDIAMFLKVATNCGATIALTSTNYAHAKKIAGIKDKLSSFAKRDATWPEHLIWVTTDTLISNRLPVSLQAYQLPNIHSPDLAFLQYTSGSTSAPKGVQLTHGNLNHNLLTLSSSLRAGRDSIVVSWLPQYHDMGLIGAYLGVLFNGGVGVYMSPFSFIKNPCLWLKLISKYRANQLQAPNFAYALCARKANASDLNGVDLSCIQHMITGAEPVQQNTIESFYETFRPYGLNDNVIKPTYGLAEHTVFVCGSNGDLATSSFAVEKETLEKEHIVVEKSDSCNKNTKIMVGCGLPLSKDHGVHLKIVDAESNEELSDGQVGEIWLSSDSAAQGYFGQEELTKEIFAAQVKDDPNNRMFLRTGDLGAIYKSQLLICGRLKDLVIIRGRNHYPQDLEATCESLHDDIRPGCSAAFSYVASNTASSSSTSSSNDDEEKLALVAELRDASITHKASLCTKIRASIAKEHGVKVTLILLLEPRSIPKTTSGKISRSRCKAGMVAGTLNVVYKNEDIIADADDLILTEDDNNLTTNNNLSQKADTTNLPSVITGENPEEVRKVLLKDLASLLSVDIQEIDPTVPLPELGMDSMALTQYQGIITQKYHVHVQEELLYNENTSFNRLHAALCGDTQIASEIAANGEHSSTLQPKRKLFCGCIAC